MIFILESQYNKGNLFLINLFNSANKGLNSAKNEVTWNFILTLGCRTVSLEILATSNKLFTHLVWYLPKNQIVGSIFNCNKRCDICTNFMVFDKTFKCTAKGK